METNEIMNNEEIVEDVADMNETNSNSGLKVVAGLGIAALVGGLAYKFAIKPVVAKIKKKKEDKYVDVSKAETVEDVASEEE